MAESEVKMEEPTLKETVEKVLGRCGCQTSKQIATLCSYWYNTAATPSQVGGALRSLAREDKIASSNCGNGATVYWLTKKEF